MTIYVDKLFEWPAFGYRWWFHMTTDQADLTELHAMARAIGVNHRHFQDKPHFPHYDGTGRTYDLAEQRRQKALALGAQEVSTLELAALRRPRRAATVQQQRTEL
jgi:Protein of unknown function (DUF4031)